MDRKTKIGVAIICFLPVVFFGLLTLYEYDYVQTAYDEPEHWDTYAYIELRLFLVALATVISFTIFLVVASMLFPEENSPELD